MFFHSAGCNISEENVSKISQSLTPNLEELYININSISGASLFDRSRSSWPKLSTLKISGTNQSAENRMKGISNITQFPLNNLKVLTISTSILTQMTSELERQRVSSLGTPTGSNSKSWTSVQLLKCRQ